MKLVVWQSSIRMNCSHAHLFCQLASFLRTHACLLAALLNAWNDNLYAYFRSAPLVLHPLLTARMRVSSVDSAAFHGERKKAAPEQTSTAN
eukprot:6195022-Pleurochrysis_carterae.AAC.5